MDVLKRFRRFVEVAPNGRHLWNGALFSTGYGQFTMDRKNWRAHRAAYVLFVGEIPDGQVVRHKCDTPACVNPDHLEVGTQKDNMRDMWDRGRQNDTRRGEWNRLKTECKQGHEFSPSNTNVTTTKNGGQRRSCRTCADRRSRDAYNALYGRNI